MRHALRSLLLASAVLATTGCSSTDTKVPDAAATAAGTQYRFRENGELLILTYRDKNESTRRFTYLHGQFSGEATVNALGIIDSVNNQKNPLVICATFDGMLESGATRTCARVVHFPSPLGEETLLAVEHLRIGKTISIHIGSKVYAAVPLESSIVLDTPGTGSLHLYRLYAPELALVVLENIWDESGRLIRSLRME